MKRKSIYTIDPKTLRKGVGILPPEPEPESSIEAEDTQPSGKRRARKKSTEVSAPERVGSSKAVAALLEMQKNAGRAVDTQVVTPATAVNTSEFINVQPSFGRED